MTNSRSRAAVGLTFLAAVASSACGTRMSPPRFEAGRGASSLGRTASGRHLLALVDVINAGDSASIRRFGAAHYSAAALDQSGGLDRLFARWLEIGQVYGPMVVDSVMGTSETETSAWIRGAISGAWMIVRLATDSAPAPRVIRIGLGRGISPPYAAARAPSIGGGELARHVDQYMHGLAQADLFSGVVLIAKDGAPIIQRGYGVADVSDRRPFTVDTSFDLASIGKLFTVVSIMQLVERGKLRLTDTVSRHVPELPRAVGDRITISQLLDHSSGLGELGPTLDSAMKKAASVSEMIRLFTDTTLSFSPGASFQYSNRGFVILGAIVERASGQRYTDYVNEHIFRLAGMTRTGLFAADALPADRARRYTRYPTLRSPFTPGARVEFNPKDDLAPGPHGGAYSTAHNLLQFSRALSRGMLISAATLAAITPPPDGRAKGFDAGGEGRARYYGHGGGAPGMSSVFRVFPDAGYTLIVLSNYDAGANISGAYLSSLLR